MNSENLNYLDIPQPDPEWDYYELWEMAYRVHQRLEETINYMVAVEKGDDSTDERLRLHFYELSKMCQQCSHEASGASGIIIDELLKE